MLAIVALPALPCKVIEADRIVGADLAHENESFQPMDEAADLGHAPAAGAKRIFRVSELRTLSKQFAVNLDAETLKEICFERATWRLTADALAPVLEKSLGDPEAHIEILDFSRQPLPLGALVFPRSSLATGGLWRGSLTYGDHRSVPVWVRVRITGADGALPLIRRGDKVRVEVRSGGVVLGFDALAESGGHAGEGVVVRNPANGKRVRALVEANGKVAIQK